MEAKFLRGLALGLALSGLCALAAAFVLRELAERYRVVPIAAEESAHAVQREALLAADLAEVRRDLAALAEALTRGMPQLAESLEEGAQAREEARARELASLRADVEGIGRELSALRLELASGRSSPAPEAVPEPDAARAGSVATEAVASEARSEPPQLEPSSAPARASTPADDGAAAPTGKSFLAFQLPSQAFAFDRAQRLVLLPALSRVGFDAQTTLHDFSGVADGAEGELEVDLAHPERGCAGEVRVAVRSLLTGEDGRDEGLRERLEAERAPRLSFRWSRFEPEAIDADALSVRGTAHGQLVLRGESHPFAMPVRVRVDESKRVHVEGEAPLDLRTWSIPVPDKLGLITMKPLVRVWIALVARAEGPAQELARAR